MKVSEMTFEKCRSESGVVCCTHINASDSIHILKQIGFTKWQRDFIRLWGDQNVTKQSYYYTVNDRRTRYSKARSAYFSDKGAFCAKYGCE